MQTFYVKTKVCSGEGAMDILESFHGRNAVIFTDTFMVKSGVAARVAEKLSGCANVRVFDEIKSDPPIELVASGLRFLLEANADLVVALGGGSSIDAAKATILMAKRSGAKDGISLIAIPTTSGTGSEVTSFAVITDREKGVKYPLVDEELLPDYAIMDPALVVSAPPRITADTGFDVITHALEAYISVGANDYSDALAEKALELAFAYLPRAYADGADLVAREKMHTASCLAGMAFNAVSLGINHGIAHQLGARFHIPHGRANAMLLPHVVRFNANLSANFGAKEETAASLRIAHIARRIGLSGDDTNALVLALIRHLFYLLKMTETPVTLADAGVSKEAYEAARSAMIDAALKDACTATNPRPVTSDDVAEILAGLAKW
ncbi:MAG: iron-containing alcohol dehydrogenase [Clostridia bacterium]|nr:iron-containing alcohol dehydrogenase [Clostridia bacterium]